ncbi:MAG: hypothetical protein IT210_03665 [Armatimonadetes bacterium]|nr:hypothetical protein [Armatimonadota bacterium]
MVGSWNELQNQLYAEPWNEEIGRFRSNFAFRGLPDTRFDLTTGLSRLKGSSLEPEGQLLLSAWPRRHDTLRRR